MAIGRVLAHIHWNIFESSVELLILLARIQDGRPALIINKTKYNIKNITQCVINIPWRIEVVWALLTPFNAENDSLIQIIIFGPIYLKPGQPSKWHTELLDHITHV